MSKRNRRTRRQDPSDVAMMPLDEMTTAMLHQVGSVFDKHVMFPSPEARDAVVLWVMHSHVYRAFDSTPRLSIRSTQPGSGKSVVLDIVQELAPNAIKTVNLTPGAMWRLMEHVKPTLVVDEADTVFGKNGSSSAHSTLRAIINEGHKRTGSVPRCVGSDDVKMFNVFGAVAMAGLGRLPQTMAERSIEVVMKKLPNTGPQRVVPLRMRFVESALAAVRGQLEAWGKVALPALAESMPDLPVKARMADVWEAPVAIADLAGGEWPERARKACVKLSGQSATEKTASVVQLLMDVREAFDNEGSKAMFTHELLDSLHANPSQLWEKLDSRKLGSLLRDFGVSPKMLRRGTVTARGYTREMFEAAWDYCSAAMRDAAAEQRDEMEAGS